MREIIKGSLIIFSSKLGSGWGLSCIAAPENSNITDEMGWRDSHWAILYNNIYSITKVRGDGCWGLETQTNACSTCVRQVWINTSLIFPELR